jgi:hypothetical protein
MKITKKKDDTFDLTGVTAGKLLAIVNAIDKQVIPTSVANDVRNIIVNNPDFKKEIGPLYYHQD